MLRRKKPVQEPAKPEPVEEVAQEEYVDEGYEEVEPAPELPELPPRPRGRPVQQQPHKLREVPLHDPTREEIEDMIEGHSLRISRLIILLRRTT